jgi:hypothetical protein
MSTPSIVSLISTLTALYSTPINSSTAEGLISSLFHHINNEFLSSEEISISLHIIYAGESIANNYSLLTLQHDWIKNNQFDKLRPAFFQLHLTALIKHSYKLHPFIADLINECFYCIRAERLGRVKEKAFELMNELLLTKSNWQSQQYSPQQMVQALFNELNGPKSKLTATIRGLLLSSLGLLSDLHPAVLIAEPTVSKKLAALYTQALGEEFDTKKDVHSAATSPSYKLTEGCFIGLRYFLNNFNECYSENAHSKLLRTESLYNYTKYALSMQQETRFHIVRAALDLFKSHCSLFQAYVTKLKEAEFLLSRLLSAAKHNNPSVAMKGISALEAYLMQLNLYLCEQSSNNEQRAMFSFLTKTFAAKLDENNKTVAEVSLSIRSFGALARSIVIYMNIDSLKSFLLQLLATADRLFRAGSLEEIDKATAHFSSFLTAFAYICKEIQDIDSSVSKQICSLIQRFFLTFPTLTQSQRHKNYISITRLFTVLSLKSGGLFNEMLEKVVKQGLILSITPLPQLIEAQQSAAESLNNFPRFSYVEYCYLWHNLLGLTVAQDENKPLGNYIGENNLEWNKGLNLPVISVEMMRRQLFNQIIVEFLKLIKTFDLTLVRRHNHEDQNASQILLNSEDKERNSERSGNNNQHEPRISSGSDIQSLLTPLIPKDYELYLSLIEFVQRFFFPPYSLHHVNANLSQSPSFLTEWCLEWLVVIIEDVISLSSGCPLVSGFYKVMATFMRIASKHKYFDSKKNLQRLQCNVAGGEENDEELVMKGGVKEEREDIKMEKYSEQNSADNQQYVYELIHQYLRTVVLRAEQYKDELLFSSIQFLLSVPAVFVDISLLLSALIRSLELGKSYRPAAVLAIETLERWSSEAELSSSLATFLPRILPLFYDYIRLPRDEESNAIQAHQAAKFQGKAAKARSVVTGLTNEDFDLISRILEFLGRVGGQNKSVLNGLNEFELSLSWDSAEVVHYALPFNKKLDVSFDKLLPNIAHLAQHSSDRKLKITASESLHSMIIYMIASTARDPNRVNNSEAASSSNPPSVFANLYKKLFPVILKLACDAEAVTRQLFQPLTKQLIHWFTNTSATHHKETIALLDAISDAVGGDHNNADERDYASSCLAEFFLWSMKHHLPSNSSTRQFSSNINVKSLLRRLYSLARHPNAYRRLGAAATFNRIYQSFRESNDLVSIFTLEIIYNWLLSLQLAEREVAQSEGSGIIEATDEVLSNFTRIVVDPQAKKSLLLLKPHSSKDGRRAGPDCCADLDRFVAWLFTQIGRREYYYRKHCMELFLILSPLTNEAKSSGEWVQSYIAQHCNNSIGPVIELFEHSEAAATTTAAAANLAAPNWLPRFAVEIRNNPAFGVAEQCSELFSPLDSMSDEASAASYDCPSASIADEIPPAAVNQVNAIIYWLDSVSSSIESYLWFIKADLFPGAEVLLFSSANSNISNAINQYLNFIALNPELNQYISKTCEHALANSYFNKKLILTIRILRCVALLLQTLEQSSSQPTITAVNSIVENSCFAPLLLECLLTPQRQGFILSNTRRIKDLQETARTVCCYLRSLSNEEQKLINLQPLLAQLQPYLTQHAAIHLQAAALHSAEFTALIAGYKCLYSSGLLNFAYSPETIERLSEDLLSEVYSYTLENNSSLSPLMRHIAFEMLQLSFQCASGLESLFSHLTEINSGLLFYTQFRSLIDSFLATQIERAGASLCSYALQSKQLMAVLVNIAVFILERKVRKAKGSAIMQKKNVLLRREEKKEEVSDEKQGMLIDYNQSVESNSAELQAEKFVQIILLHLPTAITANSSGASHQGDNNFSQSQSTGNSKKKSAAHRKLTACNEAIVITKLLKLDGSDDELAASLLILLHRMLLLDANQMLSSGPSSLSFLLSVYLQCLCGSASLALKRSALKSLNLLIETNNPAIEQRVATAIRSMIFSSPFPVRSSDLRLGSSEWKDYIALLDQFLAVLQNTKTFQFLSYILPLLRESNHSYKQSIHRAVHNYLRNVNEVGKPEQSARVIRECFDYYLDMRNDDSAQDNTRIWLAEQVLVPLLNVSPLSVVKEFFIAQGAGLWQLLAQHPEGPSADEIEKQLLELQELTVAYNLIEILFKRLDQNTINNECGVAHKDVMKIAHAHTQKLADADKLNFTPFRSAAYNTLVAALIRTQSQIKFFEVLAFKENAAKNELLYQHIIDCKAHLEFRLDTNFAVAQENILDLVGLDNSAANSYANTAAAEKFSALASHYLADSSLSQSMQIDYQIDKSTPKDEASNVQQAEDENRDNKSVAAAALAQGREGDGVVANTEIDPILSNPSIPVLINLIDHMERSFGSLYSQSLTQPNWMLDLYNQFLSSSVHINVKWSLCKLVVCRSHIFERYAGVWFSAMVQFLIQPSDKIRAFGFHYFLRDFCSMFLQWNYLPSDERREKELASAFIAHLMTVSVDYGRSSEGKRAKLKSNLLLIKLLIEKWKSKITIDKQIMYNFLSAPIVRGERSPEGITRRNIGLQLLYLTISAGFLGFDPIEDVKINEAQFIQALLSSVQEKYKTLYEPAAEVYGLLLQSNAKRRDRKDNQPYIQAVTSFLIQLFHSADYTQLLNILTKLGVYCNELQLFNSEFMNYMWQVPVLHGELMQQYLQVVFWAARNVTDIYIQLRPRIDRVLKSTDIKSIELVLMILFRNLIDLSLKDLTELIPQLHGVATIHHDVQCRVLYYKILIWVYDNHSQFQILKKDKHEKKGAMEAGKEGFYNLILAGLLKGLSDPVLEVRERMMEFFDHSDRMKDDLPGRLLDCLTVLYQPQALESWLQSAVNLLLFPMKRSSDYERQISEIPLQEVQFQPLAIHADMLTRSVGFTPAFSSQLIEQGEENSMDLAAEGEVKGVVEMRAGGGGDNIAATQSYRFPATQSLLSMDAEQLVAYNLSQQSQSDYLYFKTSNQSAVNRASQFGSYMPGLSSKSSLAKQRGKRGPERGSIKQWRNSVRVGSEDIIVRFSASQSSQGGNLFSKQADYRNRYSKVWEARRKEELSDRVVLYRKYRTGELPDIQILHRDLLQPLAALHQDPTLAKQLFILIVKSLFGQLGAFFNNPEQIKAFKTELAEAVKHMLISIAQLPSSMHNSATAAVFALEIAAVHCGQQDSTFAARYDKAEIEQIGRISHLSNNFHSGIVFLEHLLANHTEVARSAQPQQSGLVSSVTSSQQNLIELSRLYGQLGEQDITLNLFTKFSKQNYTKEAVQCQLNGDYQAAMEIYDAALNKFDEIQQLAAAATDDEGKSEQKLDSLWRRSGLAPTDYEVELWSDCRLDMLANLLQWKTLRENVMLGKKQKDTPNSHNFIPQR